MEQKSTFGLALKPGLIIAGGAIAFNLLVWSLTSDLDMQKYMGWILYPILAFAYYYFTVDYRDNVKEGHLSYGQSFVFMLLISVVYSVLFSIYYFVFLNYIDPEMINKMMDVVEQQYYDTGMSEEQIDQAMKIVSYMFSPVLMTVMTIFGGVFSGVILSLIMSIFTKKEVPMDFNNFQNQN